jgi:hypothetical protein
MKTCIVCGKKYEIESGESGWCKKCNNFVAKRIKKIEAERARGNYTPEALIPIYWAVRWDERIMISDRTANPCLACRTCFGIVKGHMQVCPLGELKPTDIIQLGELRAWHRIDDFEQWVLNEGCDPRGFAIISRFKKGP